MLGPIRGVKAKNGIKFILLKPLAFASMYVHTPDRIMQINRSILVAYTNMLLAKWWVYSTKSYGVERTKKMLIVKVLDKIIPGSILDSDSLYINANLPYFTSDKCGGVGCSGAGVLKMKYNK